ncbi:MAG TPA: hypothetical protein GXX42_05905 [Petrimonas sp.]|nr:hypothetical protein [Petrimonas sp.]
MSAFLGWIHYWLYKKIRFVVEREQLLYERAEELCGPMAEEIRATVWESYGEPLPDVDLAEVIDHTNIHGWLQRQITLAETREAAVVKALVDHCGDAGLNAAGEVFAAHGEQCGRDAQASGKYDLTGADGIYRALNDYFLNGMPCDQADMLVVNTPEQVAWENTVCLKGRHWNVANIDAAVMRGLYQKWLAGFVQAANPAFYFAQTVVDKNGTPAVRNEIRRK